MKNIVIGLTGSSGSGKSEAAKILSKLGAAVIDADAISHSMSGERDVLDELVKTFGDWVVDGHGKFNRQVVSKRAFSDKGFLNRLTEIMHRYIIREIYRRVTELKADEKIIVIDAPIPVEKGFLDISDVVWVMSSSRGQRADRVAKRDNIEMSSIEARFSSQISDAEYAKLADVIIDNSGTLDELEAELARQIHKLTDKAI